MGGELVLRKIEVGQIGFSKLFIKLIKVKQSSHPKVAIVCNIHGDEVSSLFIVSELIPRLLNEIRKGEVIFFTFSNPAAFLLRERTWKDRLDLNRIFPGKMNENLTSQIAFKLSKELRKMDLVIDLHNKKSHTALIGLFMNEGSRKIKRKSLELLNEFSPDIIWKIKEEKYHNALGPFLSRSNIVNFAIEMNPPEFQSQGEIRRITNGILRVLAKFEIIKVEESRVEKKNIPIVSRVKIISDKSGLFFPLVKILQHVNENEKIGKLTTNFIDWLTIKAPINGIVMWFSPMDFVNTGDELASIGKIEEGSNPHSGIR